MNIILVDDEPLVLKGTAMIAAEVMPEAERHAFTKAQEALAYAAKNTVDIAFLDISMRVMDGITMAKELQRLNPRINIIFCTGYSEYMLDAFELRASDYLMKPVTAEKMRHAIESLRFSPEYTIKPDTLYAHCFGEFELYYNGKPLHSLTKRAKELFAYLVFRRGEICATREIMDVVFGSLAESYFRVARMDLESALADIGQSDVLIKQWGKLGLDVSRIVCDWYEYERGNPWAINRYQPTMMEQYDWAK